MLLSQLHPQPQCITLIRDRQLWAGLFLPRKKCLVGLCTARPSSCVPPLTLSRPCNVGVLEPPSLVLARCAGAFNWAEPLSFSAPPPHDMCTGAWTPIPPGIRCSWLPPPSWHASDCGVLAVVLVVTVCACFIMRAWLSSSPTPTWTTPFRPYRSNMVVGGLLVLMPARERVYIGMGVLGCGCRYGRIPGHEGSVSTNVPVAVLHMIGLSLPVMISVDLPLMYINRVCASTPAPLSTCMCVVCVNAWVKILQVPRATGRGQHQGGESIALLSRHGPA